MEMLRKKWNSSRGASILMALLFLLVCMMVGASVLMAASSNAGKIKSNREEQQKYLTLSSALTLICDELESVEYVGKYCYGSVRVEREEITGHDEKGNPQTSWVYYRTEHYYWQETGEIRKKDKTPWGLNLTLPLYNDLDVIFADHFEVPDGEVVAIDKYIYDPLDKTTIQPKSPHTVKVKTGDSVAASTYGRLTDEVTIKAELNAEGEVTLTATFTADDSYIMEAVLKPSGKPESVIVLSGSPAQVVSFGTKRNDDVTVSKEAAAENVTEKSITWTLDHIVKKEKDEKKEAADEETP